MTFKAHIEATIPAQNFNEVETIVKANPRQYCGYQSSHDVANNRFNIVINPLNLSFAMKLLTILDKANE